MISKEIMLSDGKYYRVLDSEYDFGGDIGPGYYLCVYMWGKCYTIKKFIIG